MQVCGCDDYCGPGYPEGERDNGYCYCSAGHRIGVTGVVGCQCPAGVPEQQQMRGCDPGHQGQQGQPGLVRPEYAFMMVYVRRRGYKTKQRGRKL